MELINNIAKLMVVYLFSVVWVNVHVKETIYTKKWKNLV
jgi:hypothetical protein